MAFGGVDRTTRFSATAGTASCRTATPLSSGEFSKCTKCDAWFFYAKSHRRGNGSGSGRLVVGLCQTSQHNRERLCTHGAQAGVLHLEVRPLTVAVSRRLPNDSRRRASSERSTVRPTAAPAGWVGWVELAPAVLAEITLSNYSSKRLTAAELSPNISIYVRYTLPPQSAERTADNLLSNLMFE